MNKKAFLLIDHTQLQLQLNQLFETIWATITKIRRNHGYLVGCRLHLGSQKQIIKMMLDRWVKQIFWKIW